MRPLYLLCVLWGPRYRSYFSNYCLPSLLAPRNLALLSIKDGHKFLMCTTAEDWHALQTLPIMSKLQQHLEPILIEIGLPGDVPDPITAKFRHMSLGQRKLAEAAHQKRALGCFVWPDTVYSNGSIDIALRHAAAGAHAVLTPGIRLTEDDLFPQLERHGILPHDHAASNLSEIVAEPRTLVRVAMPCLYEDTHYFDWDSTKFADWPSTCIWSVPGGRGLLMHSSYFNYSLVDFATITTHETQGFESASLENSWLSDNFPDPARICVIQDTDELVILSWTPRGMSPPPHRQMKLPFLSAVRKGVRLRRMWHHHFTIGDIQKTYNFRYPIRIHIDDLDSSWAVTEARARRIMMWFFGDIYDEFSPVSAGWIALLRVWWTILRRWIEWEESIRRPFVSARLIRAYAVVCYRALAGNADDRARIRRRAKAVLNAFLQR